jgi:uncharacterized SAM-binding protein YcdF (DUF218 family)
VQSVLTALALPPLLFTLACLAGALLAWRGRRWGAALAALAAGGQLLLATPFAAGLLLASLDREAAPDASADGHAPGAIIVLAAEVARGRAEVEVGPMTLERLRAGAVLHRRTGLPILVAGGPIAPDDPPLAALMARSLAGDFGVTARWVEPRSRDTRENAAFSAALLREAGIGTAHLVTHGWHMPRAREAFARQGFPALPAPVRLGRVPDGRLTDWVPRADRLAESWFALREWAGRLVYALRD